MNFKELLKRYREGTATEEERLLVEKELEKYESIEEYFSEDLSDRFLQEEFSSEEDPRESNTENKAGESQPEEKDLNIQKLVNRRLRKVILTSVIIVVLLYVTVFYGVSAVVDEMYYDPTAVTEAEEGDYPRTDFHFDMTAYVSLNMPGYAISSFTPVLSEGFGDYELHYPLRNLFSRETENHTVKVSRGSLTYAEGGIFKWENRADLWGGFELIQYPGRYEFEESEDVSQEEAQDYQEQETERKNNITLNYLEELNPLSYLSMHVVFEEDLSMMEFHQLSREHQDLAFKWVGIRTTPEGKRWSENQPMHLIGFNPNSGDEPSSNSRPDPAKYPLFNLNDRWDEPIRSEEDFAEIYETHFHSRLSYISQREEFVEIFDYNPYKVDFYQEALDYIEQEGIHTYGVVVYGTAEDFSEAIEDLSYESIYIDDVLPTNPNIYY